MKTINQTLLLSVNLLLLTAVPGARGDMKRESTEFRQANGSRLEYTLYTPSEVPRGQKVPLILFLHGAGDRGAGPLITDQIEPFIRPENQQVHPGFVVTPRVPLLRGSLAPPQRPQKNIRIPIEKTHVRRGPAGFLVLRMICNKKVEVNTMSFANFRLSEGDEAPGTPIDFRKSPITVYKGWSGEEPREYKTEISPDGSGLSIINHLNHHRFGVKIPLDYTITDNTVIHFDLVEPTALHTLDVMIVPDDSYTEEKWVMVDWGSKKSEPMPEEPSYAMAQIPGLIAHLLETRPIDPDRIYVVGFSMGGFGAFDAVTRYPDLFAAGVSMAGGGDVTQAHRIQAPMWIFHGSKDPWVRFDQSQRMADAITQAGGSARLIRLEGESHMIVPKSLATPGLFDWLYEQRRGKPTEQ